MLSRSIQSVQRSDKTERIELGFSEIGGFEPLVENHYALLSRWGNPTLAFSFSGMGNVRCLTWSPDGEYLFVGTDTSPYFYWYHRSLIISPITSLVTATARTAPLTAMAISPSDSILTHLNSEGVKTYVKSGYDYTNPFAAAASIALTTAGCAQFDRSGYYLAVGASAPDYFKLYEMTVAPHYASGSVRYPQTYNVVTITDPPTIKVNSVAWHPSGSMLVTGYDQSNMAIYGPQSDGTFTQLSLPLPGTLCWQTLSVAWSPDGKYLASAGSSPYLVLHYWDGSTFYTCPVPDSPPTSIVNCVAWHPNGQYLAVGCQSNPYIIIYSRNGGNLTRQGTILSGVAGPVNGLSWSPDGRYLAIGTQSSNGLVIYKTGLPDPSSSARLTIKGGSFVG